MSGVRIVRLTDAAESPAPLVSGCYRYRQAPCSDASGTPRIRQSVGHLVLTPAVHLELDRVLRDALGIRQSVARRVGLRWRQQQTVIYSDTSPSLAPGNVLVLRAP